MKLLWLCNIPDYIVAKEMDLNYPFGGSWVVAATKLLSSIEDVELHYCFVTNSVKTLTSIKVFNIIYHAIPVKNPDPSVYERKIEQDLSTLLNMINPDLIHVFGTEYPHTLAMINVALKKGICEKVIVNIQGLCSEIQRFYFEGIPKCYINRSTVRDLLKNDNIKKQQEKFKIRGLYEIEALKKVKNVIGRTTWDKACVRQINNQVNYFSWNEVLREPFYKNQWDISLTKKHSIFISQCNYPIKGFHFLLMAMPYILEEYPNTHIYVAGPKLTGSTVKQKIRVSYYHVFLKKLIKQYYLYDHITFLGRLDAFQMCQQYLNAHVYVLPSMIENESNSLSEAKILGVPSVAAYVGGIPDRVKHGEDGFLYQNNAPNMLAYYVCKIFSDNNLAKRISEKSRINANEINDRVNNTSQLINIYKQLLNGGIL